MSSTMLAMTVAVLVVAATRVEAASKLPANFKRCGASDPKLNECLRQAVEDAFHKMKDGISSLGVLPVDPLKVNQIMINQGEGPVSITMDLTNITIYGLAETKMLNYSAELDKGILELETLTPLMRMDFHHVVNGRILVLPMRGTGPGRFTMGDLKTTQILRSSRKEKKDGRMYWNIQDYKIKLIPKTLTMNFDGLFGGDERLGNQLNKFMNQNSMLIFEEIGGSFEEAFGAVFKEITHRVFSKVPFDEIFIADKRA